MPSSNNLTVNNIVKFQPPIAKTTSDLLRSKLLSPDRIKFNNSTNINTITSNNTYYKYYQVCISLLFEFYILKQYFWTL